MTDKKAQDVKTFIEKVNKKDKQNGLKIRFAFTKNKRKEPSIPELAARSRRDVAATQQLRYCDSYLTATRPTLTLTVISTRFSASA